MTGPYCPLCHTNHDEYEACPPVRREPARPGPKPKEWSATRREPRSWKPENGSPPFQAQWPGECTSCGADFDEGDMIRFNADDEIVCKEC